MRPKNRVTGVSTLLLGLAIGLPSAASSGCERQTPAHAIALLELYTSEGCNSCPPADAYLRDLYRRGFTAEQVVPLSMHVDYWDYIGWKDRFASQAYTQRQYWLTANVGRHSVYTPEFFLSGREQRDSDPDAIAGAVRAINARPATVDIKLSQVTGTDGVVSVMALASAVKAVQGRPLELRFVAYEGALSTQVKDGENRGATLMHGYVARVWSAPVALDAQGHATINWRAELPPDAKVRNVGYVAFVQDTHTGEVLQALSLPACDGL